MAESTIRRDLSDNLSDAMHFKCSEGNAVVSKAFYTVLGINQEGKKDALGLFVSFQKIRKNLWLI